MTDELFNISVSGQGQGALTDALNLVLVRLWPPQVSSQPRRIKGWSSIPSGDETGRSNRPVGLGLRSLVSLGSQPVEIDCERFPGPISDPCTLAVMALSWLDQLPAEDWGPKPDTDGSVERGWLLEADALNHSAWNWWDIAIYPHYLIFGK